jgi:hypothetical protein
MPTEEADDRQETGIPNEDAVELEPAPEHRAQME